MRKYRVLGVATVHVYVDVQAQNKTAAVRKAEDLNPGDWTEEWCGALVEVEVGDAQELRKEP